MYSGVCVRPVACLSCSGLLSSVSVHVDDGEVFIIVSCIRIGLKVTISFIID